MDIVQKFTVWVVPVIFAITLHEVAHGWMARWFGDTTAADAGRLTLNPIKHIDPIGSILIPGILLAIGGFIFGWAKPVPVNALRMRNPKRDMAVVAAAGPAANLVMALFWAIVAKASWTLMGDYENYARFFLLMGYAGISINLALMILNLIPLPPLDGGRVLAGIVPDQFSLLLARIEPFGLFIIFGLLALGVLSLLLSKPYEFLISLIAKVFQIPFA